MHVEWVTETDSTNTELVRRAAGGTLPDRTVLVTSSQTAGRGRLGRSWVAPTGTTIAVSIYVRATEGLAWLPFAAGLAMTRAVRALIPAQPVFLKWPNDVLVDGLKISGLLGEIVPSGGAVMGAGLNLTMSSDQLPVPTATSLTLMGASPEHLAERALAGYLEEFEGVWASFESAGFDAEAGLRASVSAACGTLGREIRVELPGGSTLVGVAESIDAEGRLVVREGDRVHAVAAGDVTHVRLR